MAETGLPTKIDPSKYAEQERHLTGQIDISKLTRFNGYLVESKGFLDVDLRFFKDPDRVQVMAGRCQGTVQMTCERCLEACDVQIDSEFELGFVYNDEQAKHLAKQYEPAFKDEDGKVELLPLLEDEAILALPMYANHPDGECELAVSSDDTVVEDKEADKENPFAVLEQLKNR